MAQRTATRGAAAARRSERTSTRSAAAEPRRRQRPALEVVERSPRARVISPTAVLATVLACALAFGALSVQISLIHRQQRLDAIRTRITDLQEQNKELREEESRLQAPSEILRIARDELGMVEARPPALVTPEGQQVAAAPTTDPPASDPSAGSATSVAPAPAAAG